MGSGARHLRTGQDRRIGGGGLHRRWKALVRVAELSGTPEDSADVAATRAGEMALRISRRFWLQRRMDLRSGSARRTETSAVRLLAGGQRLFRCSAGSQGASQ